MDVNKIAPMYLGDSVYAQLDKLGGMLLTTGSHIPREATANIYLEPETLDRFTKYLIEKVVHNLESDC